jgi:hypothetical protein
MKVSEWLRRYQVSGEVPDTPSDDPMMAFWCGWLIGHGMRGVSRTYDEARDMAIKVAEFIEERAK